MNIGVFAADPGGATGLAWGIFNPHLPDIGDQLRTRLHSGSTTVSGDEREQIKEVAEWWNGFYNQCVNDALLPVDRVWFLMENFIYTGSNTYAGDSASISTALIWGIEGYRMGRRDEWLNHARGKNRKAVMPSMILQTASEAKSYCPVQKLKTYGCWVVGRDHERSAFQHIAYFLRKYQIQGIG